MLLRSMRRSKSAMLMSCAAMGLMLSSAQAADKITNGAPDPIQLSSDDTAALIELLQACDKALTKCQKQRAFDARIVEAHQKEIARLADRVGELEAASSSIINSKLLWFGLGVVATGLSVHLLNR